MKYRQKQPPHVDAFQWHGLAPFESFVVGLNLRDVPQRVGYVGDWARQYARLATAGDWIVLEGGTLHLYSDESFRDQYEAVVDGVATITKPATWQCSACLEVVKLGTPHPLNCKGPAADVAAMDRVVEFIRHVLGVDLKPHEERFIRGSLGR